MSVAKLVTIGLRGDLPEISFGAPPTGKYRFL